MIVDAVIRWASHHHQAWLARDHVVAEAGQPITVLVREGLHNNATANLRIDFHTECQA